ncbi:hypothetical protein D0862_04324 [Hortaea werneckii]|uniref:Steroid 5-alpha reductase C-terminal domain-containing protein n=1 Tax=Hortaea werneckii TaxID=91943 RepID=A0A3M7H224_HORWE|nr:hypothetical protein D0862_04324 [Hortaea werneckii]
MDNIARRAEPVPSHLFNSASLGNAIPATTLGIARSTLLPSIALHGGLSVIAYGVSRSTDRVEVKDYLWATGMVTNAWYTAVGRHLVSGKSFGSAWSGLGFYQKVLLGAVTVWGTRLTYRVASRSLKRGDDDARYTEVKKEPGFWNKDAVILFGMEAVFQAIIALPFTTALRVDELTGFAGPTRELAQYTRWAAAGLFTSGLMLETLSDYQLEAHKQAERPDLYTSGVWSIVRHPNYLGDALCHFALPLWCYGARLFTPLQVLGPVANYLFLRLIGGDKQNEEYQLERYSKHNPTKHQQLQQWRAEKNSFWPRLREIGNPWTLAVIGVGMLGAVAEFSLENHVPGGVA